jgi:hypothetical protein
LDQVVELGFGQPGGGEFQGGGVLDDRVEPDDVIGLDRWTLEEVVTFSLERWRHIQGRSSWS